MNRDNLLRMVEHMKTVSEEKFSMSRFRDRYDVSKNPECKSVGCIVGHCTILDKDNILKKHIIFDGEIDFLGWSYEFIGIRCRIDDELWNFLFGFDWSYYDDTVDGAIKRMLFIHNMNDNELEDFASKVSTSFYINNKKIYSHITY